MKQLYFLSKGKNKKREWSHTYVLFSLSHITSYIVFWIHSIFLLHLFQTMKLHPTFSTAFPLYSQIKSRRANTAIGTLDHQKTVASVSRSMVLRFSTSTRQCSISFFISFSLFFFFFLGGGGGDFHHSALLNTLISGEARKIWEGCRRIITHVIKLDNIH